MPTVKLGRRDEPGIELVPSADLIAVRTRSRRPLTSSSNPVPTPAMGELLDAVPVAQYPEAGVVVYRVPVGAGHRTLAERKLGLRQSPEVRFAGGVLVDAATGEPVVYTENIFIKFADQFDPEDGEKLLRDAGLAVKRKLAYATNAYFVAPPEGTGQKVFEIAARLIENENVEYCHPELIRQRARKAIFPQQWHLRKTAIGGRSVDAHANVEAAHALSLGEGVVIAIIDNGVDVDHPEFAGASKVVAPRDATLRSSDPRPKDPDGIGDAGENHGTACAGVACANGALGASGVAPKARLMPIRLAMNIGSLDEAEAFVWAADNGADVISCSWGPADGFWWKPNDPRHTRVTVLPAQTRLAIDYATTHGRGGRGCVVLFAAGNGGESVDNDGYASYSRVIAVAACNDLNGRSVYSDFGRAVWCSFPSDDQINANRAELLTPGIWTTDRTGAAGYNPGPAGQGDAAGNFTATFGGTSSACPGAAGVAALVLATNPQLRWDEVRDILRRACDRIDLAGGAYDANGHSRFYGFGRLNAKTAVELARPQPGNAMTVARQFNAPIVDLQTVEFALDVPEPTPIEKLAVEIDLKHSYIGDLVIALLPPNGTGVAPIALHNRAGSSTRDLKRRYDAGTVPGLAQFAGKPGNGRWTLRITDAAAGDFGTLVSFGLVLSFRHS